MSYPANELDEYLAELRRELRGLPRELVEDVAEELRSHLRESARSGADGEELHAIFVRLGAPAELARHYRAGARAAPDRPRAALLSAVRSFGGWCALAAAGAAPLLALVTMYLVSASLFVAAVVELFLPERAGLWRAGDAFSLHLGLAAAPPVVGEELLGGWIVPLGLAAGGWAYWLTLRVARACRERLRGSLGTPLTYR